MHRVMYSGSASTQSTAPPVSASTSCFHSSCEKVMFALFVAFVHAVNPYDLANCVQCEQCFRGIHTACIVSSDSTKTLTCSVCLDSVRRTISTEFDSTLSPAVRCVYLCGIHCYIALGRTSHLSCYAFLPLLVQQKVFASDFSTS